MSWVISSLLRQPVSQLGAWDGSKVTKEDIPIHVTYADPPFQRHVVHQTRVSAIEGEGGRRVVCALRSHSLSNQDFDAFQLCSAFLGSCAASGTSDYNRASNPKATDSVVDISWDVEPLEYCLRVDLPDLRHMLVPEGAQTLKKAN